MNNQAQVIGGMKEILKGEKSFRLRMDDVKISTGYFNKDQRQSYVSSIFTDLVVACTFKKSWDPIDNVRNFIS